MVYSAISIPFIDATRSGSSAPKRRALSQRYTLSWKSPQAYLPPRPTRLGKSAADWLKFHSGPRKKPGKAQSAILSRQPVEIQWAAQTRSPPRRCLPAA